jgi:hypothetical protein
MIIRQKLIVAMTISSNSADEYHRLDLIPIINDPRHRCFPFGFLHLFIEQHGADNRFFFFRV